MKVSTFARGATLGLGTLLAGALMSSGAHALPILSFSQVGNSNTITGTATGSTTKIGSANTVVTISQIDGAVTTPLQAYLEPRPDQQFGGHDDRLGHHPGVQRHVQHHLQERRQGGGLPERLV